MGEITGTGIVAMGFYNPITNSEQSGDRCGSALPATRQQNAAQHYVTFPIISGELTPSPSPSCVFSNDTRNGSRGGRVEYARRAGPFGNHTRVVRSGQDGSGQPGTPHQRPLRRVA